MHPEGLLSSFLKKLDDNLKNELAETLISQCFQKIKKKILIGFFKNYSFNR